MELSWIGWLVMAYALIVLGLAWGVCRYHRRMVVELEDKICRLNDVAKKKIDALLLQHKWICNRDDMIMKLDVRLHRLREKVRKENEMRRKEERGRPLFSFFKDAIKEMTDKYGVPANKMRMLDTVDVVKQRTDQAYRTDDGKYKHPLERLRGVMPSITKRNNGLIADDPQIGMSGLVIDTTDVARNGTDVKNGNDVYGVECEFLSGRCESLNNVKIVDESIDRISVTNQADNPNAGQIKWI